MKKWTKYNYELLHENNDYLLKLEKLFENNEIYNNIHYVLTNA